MATHLAGNAVIVGDRLVQRCLVCGYKLVDNKNVVAPISPDGSVPTVGTWGIGHFVRVDEGNPTRYSDVGESNKPEFKEAWEDCCLRLVEE